MSKSKMPHWGRNSGTKYLGSINSEKRQTGEIKAWGYSQATREFPSESQGGHVFGLNKVYATTENQLP